MSLLKTGKDPCAQVQKEGVHVGNATAVAGGLGGQRLYIVPDKRIVVAVNAGLYNKPLQAAIGNIVLNRYVLPALRN